MKIKSLGLIWISVKNFDQSLQFYTQNLGMRLVERNDEYGWAELEANDNTGMRLGIARCAENNKADDQIAPGSNSIVTFTVDNIQQAIAELKQTKTRLLGSLQEIPGHVKLQMAVDPDGNHFQIVEMIHACCGCSH